MASCWHSPELFLFPGWSAKTFCSMRSFHRRTSGHISVVVVVSSHVHFYDRNTTLSSCRRRRRRRRRKVNLTNELSRISYITRVTTLERKYLFTYDTRDSSLVVHYCKILNSNILSFFFYIKKVYFLFSFYAIFLCFLFLMTMKYHTKL